MNILDSQFDPELPTAIDVLAAISSIATQYAVNPSLELAEIALDLSCNLRAPEYRKTKHIEQVMDKLILQWGGLVDAYLSIDMETLITSKTIQ